MTISLRAQRRFCALMMAATFCAPTLASDHYLGLINADTPHLQAVYKDIHANPELGFMEHRTAGIVAAELEQLGFEVKTGIGGTGVVGILRNGEGPTLMYRADMDANAVEEVTGLPYASNVKVTNLDGVETHVSHMCGHDAHTTWLIGLARTIAAQKEAWSGTLVLVAQPAEEPIEGAIAMVNDGLYTTHAVPKPDYFLAMHTIPFPTGTVVASPGRISTGSEHLDITFHGVGGHGSTPQETKDPVLMAGQAITQLQTVVSRFTDPAETAVLTIGAVNAGVDNNVIPTEATLKLKLHFSTTEVHQVMVEGIKRISDSIAVANRVDEDKMPTYSHKGYAIAVVNDEALTHSIQQQLRDAPFVDKVVPQFSMAGSEDATTLVENVPGVKIAYINIGTAAPELFDAARARGEFVPFVPHNGDYQVDLNAIKKGTKITTHLVLDLLSPNKL
ncbi:amidohydrolase [Ferrimonas pelagia]|uniref:Amidohydrolase n=1 Tax=Ferrimonas pelagia TaxID=1177826 RepID=A0ABP9F5K3_9GAMM